ncbi:MAG: DUF4375 domain-containing protein [Chloroflexi bacterium]|nr:DUF4375 domain-containing protein [Chloroflexota bacterium]
MSELPWLNAYSGQTTDELIALGGAYRTDSIILAFEQAIRSKAARVGYDNLTEAERVVLAVEGLEREVNNGGYDQLFRNVPEQVPELVMSLAAIGSSAVADLTRSAIAALRIGGPLTPEAVEAAIDDENADRDAELDALDQAYDETAGDLADQLLVFVKANSAQIDLTRDMSGRPPLDRAAERFRGLLSRFR